MKLIAIYICWLDDTDCLLSLVLSGVEVVLMYFVLRFHITLCLIFFFSVGYKKLYELLHILHSHHSI